MQCQECGEPNSHCNCCDIEEFRSALLELNDGGRVDGEPVEDLDILDIIAAWSVWQCGETEWKGLQLPPRTVNHA